MRRRWVAAAALVVTGCSSTTPVQCGPCAGPGYALSGVPRVLRHAVVTVCVGEQPCATVREHEPMRTDTLQPVTPRSGTAWENYDGTPVRVTVRAGGGRWEGTGTFDYTPADGSVCGCSSLLAEVPLEPTTTPVSPRG